MTRRCAATVSDYFVIKPFGTSRAFRGTELWECQGTYLDLQKDARTTTLHHGEKRPQRYIRFIRGGPERGTVPCPTEVEVATFLKKL